MSTAFPWLGNDTGALPKGANSPGPPSVSGVFVEQRREGYLRNFYHTIWALSNVASSDVIQSGSLRDVGFLQLGATAATPKAVQNRQSLPHTLFNPEPPRLALAAPPGLGSQFITVDWAPAVA